MIFLTGSAEPNLPTEALAGDSFQDLNDFSFNFYPVDSFFSRIRLLIFYSFHVKC